MDRRNFLSWFLMMATVLGCETELKAQETLSERNLTVEEVVRLTRAGFSNELIITKLKKNGKPFDLSTDELVDLRKAGLTEDVIKYMLDPSQPYTPPVIAPNSGSDGKSKSGKKYSEDPLASRVPADPGLYFFSKPESPTLIDLRFFLGTEEKKGLMKKAKSIAFLVGPSAKAHIKTATVLYARLPEGKEIAELVLLGLDTKNGRRELAPDNTYPYDTVEVGPRLFRINSLKLAPGQYTFFYIGSADPSKGVYGKGYDFAVDASMRS